MILRDSHDEDNENQCSFYFALSDCSLCEKSAPMSWDTRATLWRDQHDKEQRPPTNGQYQGAKQMSEPQ